MKIITLHTATTPDKLLSHVQQNLNPMFAQQRQQTINFTVGIVNDAVEISQPDMYEGALFTIAINEKELWITRNEHYVDDVNSLTIESILASLFEDLTDDIRGVEMIQEG
ncbi:hypothetical protein [Mucilaginibacter antarcticus]|uniref:Uncharacterized protein n=1 Tax=Mucilaginibacter antarcticus TaxID=1855725 RepID=A0ABW5XN65_9SPHI